MAISQHQYRLRAEVQRARRDPRDAVGPGRREPPDDHLDARAPRSPVPRRHHEQPRRSVQDSGRRPGLRAVRAPLGQGGAMIDTLRQWTERLLGRGDAAITVPVLDGALRSNRLIEDAEVVAEFDAPEDLASDGRSLLIADGARVLRVDGAGITTVEHTFERPISALAGLPGGGLAVALGGSEVRVVGGPHDGRRFDGAGGKRLHAVNALAGTANGRLLASDGSQTQPPERWKHDVMELGRSGRLLEFSLADGGARERAAGLGYAFGVAAFDNDATWVCESWRHRVLQIGGASSGRAVVDALPGYPSRIAPAHGGG